MSYPTRNPPLTRLLHLFGRFAALVTLPAVVLACDTDTSGPDVPSTSTVSVYLRDAPGDVDSVWVRIDRVELKGDDESVDLLDEPTDLINLLALQDSAAALAEGVEAGEGMYRELRVHVTAGVLQSTSGEVYVLGDAEHPGGLDATGELMCPSCGASGLKVKLAGDLEMREGENALLLDFDVSQSFGHQAGKSGKWIMHPVIHGAEAEPDDDVMDEGGEISGTVVLATGEDAEPVQIPLCSGVERSLEDFVPVAVSTTLTDDEGMALQYSGSVEVDDEGSAEFEIEVTELDSYALTYTTETTFTSDKLVWEATVEPGEVTLTDEIDEVGDVEFTITGVTCESLTPQP